MYPEADALLNAIFDNPDDDTPRLVYADWLQENGHEDYAQFIRFSVKADGGSKPPSERKRLRDERFTFWQQIQAHTDAFRALSLTTHAFDRGICTKVVAGAEDFARTVATWWPYITPKELTVYDLRGRESEVARLIGEWLPRLHILDCRNMPGMDVDVTSGSRFPTMSGDLVRLLAAPGLLPKLQTLYAWIASVDFEAFMALEQSELLSQLQTMWLMVRANESGQRVVFSFDAAESFVERKRMLHEFITYLRANANPTLS